MKQKLPENSKHHFYDIHDNKSQKISAQLFDEIISIIENGRKTGGVLVHCYAGVSRSSSIVIAYVMHKLNKTYDQAKQLVKKARQCICPNDGFIHQLRSYQKILHQRQNQRLRKLEQLKRLQMDNSVVKSARKSLRGAVRGADISPQKVKQLAQKPKQITHQINQQEKPKQSSLKKDRSKQRLQSKKEQKKVLQLIKKLSPQKQVPKPVKKQVKQSKQIKQVKQVKQIKQKQVKVKDVQNKSIQITKISKPLTKPQPKPLNINSKILTSKQLVVKKIYQSKLNIK